MIGELADREGGTGIKSGAGSRREQWGSPRRGALEQSGEGLPTFA